MSFKIKSFSTIRISVSNVVDNLDELLKRAQELGGKIYRGPLRVDEIQRTIVQIQDPFGNVIGFEADYEKVS